MKQDTRPALSRPLLRVLLPAAGVVLLVLPLFRWAVSSTPDQADLQLATVTRRSFEITVHTVGVMDAERSHMISSLIKGDKGKIIHLIGDGARVRKGDQLVRLDPSPFEEDVRRLSTELQSLEAAVASLEQVLEWEKNQIEREIRTAEFNLRVAELDQQRLVEGEGPLQVIRFKEEMDAAREEFERYASYIADIQQLIDQGYAHDTEMVLAQKRRQEFDEKYQSARRKYVSYERHVLPSLVETAKARVEAAAMEIEQIRKGGVFKIAKAVATLDEAKGKRRSLAQSLDQARRSLEQTTIHAPFDGIAILYETFRDGQKRQPRVGDRVLQNQPLLYLPDISSMIVNTQVREVDLFKIQQDQRCLIRVDAYPEALLEGRVAQIGILASGHAEGGAGEKYFQLVVAVDGGNTRLRPGMTARVTVLVDRIDLALTVPVHAVFEDQGARYCYRFSERGFAAVPVVLGRHNEDVMQIVSGLAEGDKVALALPDPADIH